jgi:serine/threonine-protein kinase
MTEHDHRRSEAAIFADALEAPPEARGEFLRRACGNDTELRRRVETLLRASPEAAGWFDRARDDALAGTTPAPSEPSRSLDASGRVVAHYRLDQFVGAGGMGEVYRATDLALGHYAAVKLLRPGVSPEIRARFVQEARATVRLAHPGIAQFFESGTVDGVGFLAMELVDGETLRSRLGRGALPVPEALSIATTLLEALVHAHAAGLLHRDIKPENIMLTEQGAMKLLDFGIAKEMVDREEFSPIVETMAQAPGTQHGTILGTPGYMAPEQLRGQAVDERADVFSVGAVLYEMLSGEPAFPGESVTERVSATLSRDLPSVPGARSELTAVLNRAVSRDPSDRYSDSSTFLSDLRRVATGQAVANLPETLAVVDLQNLRGDAEDDWIGSGVAESLTINLRRAERLRLVARNTVVKARAALLREGKGNDPVALGRAVGCRWVLSGSFQRMGSSLRLTMQLVEVATGEDVWTEKLDGDVGDVFAMQDKLAELTAGGLNVVVPEHSGARFAPAIDVFEHYARARNLVLTWERGAIDQAREHLEQALELDPEYAPALAWMASFFAPARWMGTADPKDLEAALDLANRAVESDPEVAEGHLWKGYALWRQGEMTAAIESFDRAAGLDESDYLAPYFTGCCLQEMGRWQEALRAQREAATREPRSPYVLINLAQTLAESGDPDAALWAAERACEAEGDAEARGWVGASVYVSEILRRLQRLDEAWGRCKDALRFMEQHDNMMRGQFRANCLSLLGRIALERNDVEAAKVSFSQTVSLVRENPSGAFVGHALVQSLAGLTRAGAGAEHYEEARAVFESRTGYGFAWGGWAADCYSLLELARAVRSLGRDDDAQELYRRAREAGTRQPLE